MGRIDWNLYRGSVSECNHLPDFFFSVFCIIVVVVIVFFTAFVVTFVFFFIFVHVYVEPLQVLCDFIAVNNLWSLDSLEVNAVGRASILIILRYLKDLYLNFGSLERWKNGDDHLPHLFVHWESNWIIAIAISIFKVHREAFHNFFWRAICEEEVLTCLIELKLIKLKKNYLIRFWNWEIRPILRSVQFSFEAEIASFIDFLKSTFGSILHVLIFSRSSTTMPFSLGPSLAFNSLVKLFFNILIWGYFSLCPHMQCLKYLFSNTDIIVHKSLEKVLKVFTRRSILIASLWVLSLLLTACMLSPEYFILFLHKKLISPIIHRTFTTEKGQFTFAHEK